MYSSRITHLRMTPKNIDYWDYMILCHGDDAVARVLQRFEYWDGTKAGGNVHGEDLNDQQQATGQDPTQDVSRYVYKTVEELAWELLGSVSERTLPKTLDILCEQLGYLKRRNNPYSTFDHTKQYEFQETLVVAHLARLSAIVDHFLTLGRRLRPVLYAIEQLTRRGVYVAHLTRQADGSFREDESHLRLSIESVAAELRAMHTHLHMDEQAGKKKPTLPRFVRSDLAKDEQHGFCAESDLPQGLASSPGEPSSESPVALPTLHLPTPSSPTSRFSNFAETNPASSTPSIQQIEGNSAAVSPEQRGSFAETIPIITPGMTSLMTAAASGEETAATLPARDAAAPAGFQLESLSPDEIALVLEHRHKAFAQTRPEQASGSESVPEPVATIESQPNALPNGEVAIASPRDTSASPPNADEPPLLPTQAPTNRRTPGPPKPAPAGVPPLSVAPSGLASLDGMPQIAVSVPSVAPTNPVAPSGLVDPPKPPAWSPEALVALFEDKRGAPYDPATRACQLASATRLLALPLPLALRLPPDPAGFGRFYDACNDEWVKERYGEVLLSYLMEPDKASGQPRIVRLLARYAASARPPGARATTMPTPEQARGERPLIGVSGRPLYVPSGPPMKVLPPPPRERRRPGMVIGYRGV